MFILLLAANAGFGGYGSIIFIILIFGLMYFMMIRPQKKQQQKHQEMMNKLQVGDKVVTIGRLHGVVDSIDEDARTVTLDCDGIYLVFDRTAIMRVDHVEAVQPAASTNDAPTDSADQKADDDPETPEKDDSTKE
ncbi:preprotein translocase YajC subunit [Pediococcus cellicola]|uniref:Preprotein translocase YajC subunit n=1 Tax=Pediococcus cellicola TaxID=319652 RepID=A0A0R2IJD6_9LACO|nr:preprotein translocase YajC subunit [Pediococcus cellicola]